MTALSVDHRWANLTEVLLGALRGLEHAQRMADAAAQQFRVHSDPELIAAGLSKLLLEAVEREFPGGAPEEGRAGALDSGAGPRAAEKAGASGSKPAPRSVTQQ